MIVVYEMRSRGPHRWAEWVEMCGHFASWEVFEMFRRREGFSLRQVRNAKQVGE